MLMLFPDHVTITFAVDSRLASLIDRYLTLAEADPKLKDLVDRLNTATGSLDGTVTANPVPT
jgi:hypothetical protein